MSNIMENQLVVFKLDNEEYGVPISQVREIVRLQRITPVPQAPEYMVGIINLRGNTVPIIDLKRRFTGVGDGLQEESRIIIVDIGDRTLGIIVDSVEEVLRLSPETIEPPPTILHQEQKLVDGVGKVGERLLVLLNLNHLFGDEINEYSPDHEKVEDPIPCNL